MRTPAQIRDAAVRVAATIEKRALRAGGFFEDVLVALAEGVRELGLIAADVLESLERGR